MIPIKISENYRRFPNEKSKQQRTYSKYKCECGSEFEAQI